MSVSPSPTPVIIASSPDHTALALSVVATIVSLLVALVNAFGPLIARWLISRSGIDPDFSARIVTDQAKTVAESLERTQKLLATSMTNIQTVNASSAAKIDEVLAYVRKL